MLHNIGFFTPVRFDGPKTFSQKILEGIEDYFYLCGKSAYVIPGNVSGDSHAVIIKDQDQNRVKQVVLGAIKVISYMTMALPVIMLIAKAIIRAKYKFHTISNVNESLLNLDFFSNTDQISFWDHYLVPYIDAVNDKKWDSIPGLLFLNDEFQGIQGSLEKLLHTIRDTNEQIRKKIIKNDIDAKHDFNYIGVVEKAINDLLLKTKNSLGTLQKKINTKFGQDSQWQTPKTTVRGFKNVGNTCYINSALQPLLVIKNFMNLIPNNAAAEPRSNLKERQAILDSLKSFLLAWKDKKSSSDQLGQMIGLLRTRIFQAGLFQGGFLDKNQEKSFQDSGQFFELILHVIGRGFQLEMTKIPVMDDGFVINNRKRIEETPQGVFYLQSPGESLQEIVDVHREALDQSFTSGNEWRIEHPETKKTMKLSRYKEMQKIVGHAPEVLVVRVNNHVVKPEQDHLINFAALFKNPPKNCEYELVGFSQNHNQVHWTSVVYDGSHWQYCNDNNVQQVLPTDSTFKHPANYMIFQKKT